MFGVGVIGGCERFYLMLDIEFRKFLREVYIFNYLVIFLSCFSGDIRII